jgi:hypothetical protein
MGNTTTFGIRVYLDDVFPDIVYGLTHCSGNGYQHTHIGSPVIDAFYPGATAGFTIGRKVRFSAGFPSTTDFYTIIDKTSGSITVDTNAIADGHTRVEQQSELRWAERDYYDEGGLEWYGNWVIKDSIDALEIRGDLSKGGAPASYTGITIAIKNTAQEFEKMQAAGIYMTGKRAEIARFIFDEVDNLVEKKIVFTGVCEDPLWSETEIQIPIKSSLFKRNADCSTIADTGVMVPMTFGTFIPDDPEIVENLAKMLRTKASVTTFIFGAVSTSFNDGYVFTNADPLDANIEAVPVVGDGGFGSTDDIFKVKFAVAGSWSKDGVPVVAGEIDLAQVDGYGNPLEYSLANKYVKIVEGDKSIGNYRMIEAARIVSVAADATVIEITITEFFEATPHGNATANEDGNSWLIIENHEREYMLDTWPCKDFLDSSGVPIINIDNAELYSYVESKSGAIQEDAVTVLIREKPVNYIRLPTYAYKESATALHNMIQIAVTLFDSDPDEMKSFITRPVVSPELIDEDNLLLWEPTGNWIKYATGFYVNAAGKNVSCVFSDDINHICDRNQTTRFRADVTFNESADYCVNLALKFLMPSIPDFDKVFMGVNYHNAYAPYWWFNIRGKKFFGAPVTLFRVEIGPHDKTMASLPDQYYITNPATKNEHFYVQKDNTIQRFGYALFECDTTKEALQRIKWGGLLVGISGNWDFLPAPPDNTKYLYIYDLAFLFQKNVSVKEKIFTPAAGRIFNDTWGAGLGYGNELYVTSNAASDPNGNESNSVSGWVTTKMVVESSAIAPRAGSYCIKGTATDNGAGGALSNVSTQVGHTYRFSIWARRGAQGTHQIVAFWNDFTWHVFDVTSTEWTEFIFEGAASGTICTIEAGNYTGGVTGDEIYFDNLSVREVLTTRRIATDQIVDPVNMIEHLKRLGDWSETGVAVNFGKEYSPTAKIKTSGEGSFDDPSLDDVKHCRPAFQILEKNDAWTENIVKELCDTFGLCTYVDKDGYECIKNIFTPEIFSNPHFVGPDSWSIGADFTLVNNKISFIATPASGLLFQASGDMAVFPKYSTKYQFEYNASGINDGSSTVLFIMNWGFVTDTVFLDATPGIHSVVLETVASGSLGFYVIAYSSVPGDTLTLDNFSLKEIQADTDEEITKDDIVGEIGQVQEPKSCDILCQPVLNYQYDASAEKFNRQMQVTNIAAPEWLSEYTPGFEDTDGEVVWNRCKELYNKYGTVEQVPSDFSDKKMIRTYTDALYHLTYKLDWMDKKRIPLTVKYSKGKDYAFAQRVMLRLSHQTDDNSREVMIESVKINKKNVSVNLKLVVL